MSNGSERTQYIIFNLQVHYLPNLMSISYAHVWHKTHNNNDESQVTSPTKVNTAKQKLREIERSGKQDEEEEEEVAAAVA